MFNPIINMKIKIITSIFSVIIIRKKIKLQQLSRKEVKLNINCNIYCKNK